jgi:hypothetical protein
MTDFFLQEVGITQNQFNVGQQLLSLGIVLLEVGFYRPWFAASKWLTDHAADSQQLDPVQNRPNHMDWHTNYCMVRQTRPVIITRNTILMQIGGWLPHFKPSRKASPPS